MYRPPMATWLASIVKRLPLREMPSAKQIAIAKTFTGHTEAELSYSTVHALVWAQAMEAQTEVDGRLAHELFAALTWDRTIVLPDPWHMMRLLESGNRLPPGGLQQLAGLRRQTNYLVIEQPSPVDTSTFISGAWLMRDLALESKEPLLLLLMDLIVEGEPVRDVLMEFTVEDSLDVSVQRQVEKIAAAQGWDAHPGAQARRDAMRSYMLGAEPVLAAFHNTFIAHAAQLEIARAAARRDEQGFTLVDVAPGQRAAGGQLPAGLYH